MLGDATHFRRRKRWRALRSHHRLGASAILALLGRWKKAKVVPVVATMAATSLHTPFIASREERPLTRAHNEAVLSPAMVIRRWRSRFCLAAQIHDIPAVTSSARLMC